MIVYRICKREYANDLSGYGAGLYGGRWNPKGVNLLYTSTNISLASLEYLVHNYHLLSSAKICLSKIELGEPISLFKYPSGDLPINWHKQLKTQIATQKIGKEFVMQGKFHALQVPSAISPGEFNLLLNPQHKHHSYIKILDIIDPFVFDQRLLNLG